MHHPNVHPALRPLPQRWLYALKLAGWPKLLVPAVLGQVLGAVSSGEVCWAGLAIGLGFTVCQLLYIVLLNDWGDVEVDTLKRRMFPSSGSPKTIPDGVLHAQSLWLAGVGAAVMAIAVGLCGELTLPRPGLMLGAVGCVTLFWSYTFPPLRLNYRGGGEFLGMLGVGLAIPWFNAYAQGGELFPEPLVVVMPGLWMLALASAIASGLADEQSDRRGGKVTYVSEYGNSAARAAVENLVIAGALLWSFASRLAPDLLPPIIATPAVVVTLLCWRELVAHSARAGTNQFAAIRRYKQWLRRAIWGGTLTVAIGFALFELLARLGQALASGVGGCG